MICLPLAIMKSINSIETKFSSYPAAKVGNFTILPIFRIILTNLKITWAGVNEVMNRNKLKSKPITALRRLDCDEITHNPTELSSVLNDFFSSVGHDLAANVPNNNK